jgi:uncharacterized membrane protein
MSSLGTWLPSLRPSDQARFGWGRVDAFVDAVYAIAATLLVLELRPPEAEAGHLAAALLDQWPTYLVYTLGFIQIVGGWGVLRRVSAWSRGLDHYAMLLVMVAMLTYSLQPFTFAVLADAVDDRDDFVAGIRLLGTVLAISMVAFSSMMVYLRRRGLFRTEALDPRLLELAYRLAVTVWVWPVLAIALTFVVGPWALVAIGMFTLITLVPIEALPAGMDEEAARPDASDPDAPVGGGHPGR